MSAKTSAPEPEGSSALEPEGTRGSSWPGAQIFSRTFEALSVPAYRDMWLGMVVSFGGLQVAMVSRGYLAYDLSGSAGMLGLVGLATGLPMLFFSPFAGVLADRVDKRRLLLGSQVFMLTVAGLLALLIHTGLIGRLASHRIWISARDCVFARHAHAIVADSRVGGARAAR